MRTTWTLCTLLWSGVAFAGGPADLAYVLTIPESDTRSALVEATWTVGEPKMSMAGGAEQFPENWGKFLRDLTITGTAGRPVAATLVEPVTWRLDAEPGEKITLRYRMVLDHDRHDFPHGLDEAAYWKPDAVFWVGQALFIAPDDGEGSTVTVALPRGWKLSTPWPRVPGKVSTYAPSSWRELVANALMAGTHEERSFDLRGLRITLAVGGAMKGSADALVDTMRRVVADDLRIFGRSPKPSYLVTLHEGATDGGAFASSYSMLSSTPLTPERFVDWGHIVAHETFHLWNGTGIRARTPEDWFGEGATDYLTIVSLRRLGLYDEALFTKKLESHLRRYRDGVGKLNLREASADKKANWHWIYGGGAIVSLALDLELRGRSGGRQSLETLLRRLFDDHADGRYDYEELIATASALAGSDLAPFFASYVDGRERLALPELVARIGYNLVENLQGELFLVPVGAASEDQLALRRALLGGS